MNHRIVIPMLFMLIFSLIFAMSGDGSNNPVDLNKQTVKDWFGFDTGMTEKEFQEHQEAYIQRWINYQESIVGVRKNVTENKMQQLMKRTREDALLRYQWRLDINAIPKFKEFGINLIDYFSGYDAEGVWPYTYATTISQVVVHGRVIAVEGGYETKTTPVYTLEVIEILKGGFYYKILPKTIKASLWLTNYKVGDEIIAFLGIKDLVKENMKSSFEDLTLETIGTRLLTREDGHALQGLYSVGKIDHAKKIIKEIDSVNNAKDFYKINFKKNK